MKIDLPEAGKLPMTPTELCDLAVRAGLALRAMQDAKNTFDSQVTQTRTEVGNRYSSSAFAGMSQAQRQKVADTETAGRVMDARKAATVVMNAIAQKQIAPIRAALSSSKSFYKSPANTLCAMTVASDKRRVVVDNLQGATPLQLWHAGVRAMQEKDPVLAAAVLHVLGSLPPDERPFGVAEFASRFAYEPHEKAIQAMNSVERDTEAAITAWRVVTTGRHNAAGRIQVAMGAPAFEEAGDDAVALPDASEAT